MFERTQVVEDEEPVSRLDALLDTTVDVNDVALAELGLELDLFRACDREWENALVLDEFGKAIDIGRPPQRVGQCFFDPGSLIEIVGGNGFIDRDLELLDLSPPGPRDR